MKHERMKCPLHGKSDAVKIEQGKAKLAHKEHNWYISEGQLIGITIQVI